MCKPGEIREIKRADQMQLLLTVQSENSKNKFAHKFAQKIVLIIICQLSQMEKPDLEVR